MVKPSGWHTVKYPEVIEDLFLYNRCHLIAYAMTGQNANEKNLITGTRDIIAETGANSTEGGTLPTGFDYSNHIKSNLIIEEIDGAVPYIQTKFFTGKHFDYNTDYFVHKTYINFIKEHTFDIITLSTDLYCKIAAYPPTPGLPEQAPSVYNITSFIKLFFEFINFFAHFKHEPLCSNLELRYLNP